MTLNTIIEEEKKELIKKAVDRFLGWKLPEDFRPDAGISFKAEFSEHTEFPMKHKPIGTNLFDATQAEQMIDYLFTELLTTAMQRVWKDSRIDWLRSEIEKLEGMEQENNYSTAYADYTPGRAIEEEAKTQGWNQALTSIITRYKEELKVLESK